MFHDMVKIIYGYGGSLNDDTVWIPLTEEDRYCYYGIHLPDNLRGANFDEIIEWAQENPPVESIADIPHIEDASPAMQYLWRCIIDSENNMWFVEQDDEQWEEIGITKEEFERQVDDDILTYNLGDVITKNEDGLLYTCYGNLQSSFTGKVGREEIETREDMGEEIDRMETLKDKLEQFLDNAPSDEYLEKNGFDEFIEVYNDMKNLYDSLRNAGI